MRQIGTDVVAVACIVGGGVIAGGATLALAHGPELPSVECATTVGPDADVMVKLGGEGVVVVRPDVRLHEMSECMDQTVHFAIEGAMAQELSAAEEREMERAQREVERARREAERVRREVDRVRERVLHRDVEGAVERAREVRQERVQRAQERVERARERAERARERVAREGVELTDAELEELARELERVGSVLQGFRVDLPEQSFEIRFEGLEDFDFDFDFDHDFDFDFDYEFDDEALEETLRAQLEALESLDGFELNLEGFDGFDAELQREIQERVELEMRALEERLERIGNGSGDR